MQQHGSHHKATLAGLIVALGIIYGDIGTSPLYVFIFIVIGGLYYPHVILEPDFLFLFIQLYLLMIYYGLFALVLIQCFDNIYMSIIPFAFYTIASIFQDEKDNFFIFKIVLPTISTAESRGNYYQILFLMIILFFINGIIYQKRDF